MKFQYIFPPVYCICLCQYDTLWNLLLHVWGEIGVKRLELQRTVKVC